MKFLRNFMDKIQPDKAKSPFSYTLWDGIDTFLYAPGHVTHQGTHLKDSMDLKRTMIHVVLAMQFAFLLGAYNIGLQHYQALGVDANIAAEFVYGLLQLLPLIIVVHVVGLGIEFLFAAKKGHAIEEGFLVSAFLIPLIMPPGVPLYMVAIATAFSVLIAKEAFGGTGMNIFNVALVARVFIFFAYPSSISGDTCWVAYDYNILHQALNFGDWLHISAGTAMIDGFSGATPLGLAVSGGWEAIQAATLPSGEQQYSISNMMWGFMPGSIGEMSKIGIIIGAIMLIKLKIADWRIMFSMVIGVAFMGVIFNIAAPAFPDNGFIAIPFYMHYIMGSFLFAMAFMATDPVTAASTNRGKFIYGFMIGVIGLIIRVANPAYPEGWMLAIIFMNIFASLIDYNIIQSNIKRRLSNV